jgi:hypothetical protein
MSPCQKNIGLINFSDPQLPPYMLVDWGFPLLQIMKLFFTESQLLSEDLGTTWSSESGPSLITTKLQDPIKRQLNSLHIHTMYFLKCYNFMHKPQVQTDCSCAIS